jgi:hypothetical protein
MITGILIGIGAVIGVILAILGIIVVCAGISIVFDWLTK